MRLIIFSCKSPKKVLNLLKDTQNSPSTWFNVPVPKNAPPKSLNDQLPSQISKTHRQFFCLPKSLSYWLSGFYEVLKEHDSLHPKSPISWQSVTKVIETHFIFMKKSKKKYWICWKVPRIPPHPGSILCQVWKSYARQWGKRMTKQTCNQHWMRGQEVQVSLFLWLTVD